MTTRQLFQSSGITIKRKDISSIGELISNVAKRKGIERRRVLEIAEDQEYTVWDYPETFVEEMKDIMVEYFSNLRNG